MVYHAIKKFEDVIPSQIFSQMKSINMNIVKQNMLMTSELISVIKLLEENDIRAISFKGPILSQMAYEDITLRQYVDLDILVDEKDLEKSKKILIKNNYSPLYLLDNYQEKILKNVVHDISFINKNNHINVELHWTLSSGEFFIDLEYLNYFNDIDTYKLQNKKINIFSNEKMFIYLCIHGYKHLWERIEWLVDIEFLIEKNLIDIKEVLSLSEKIDANRIIHSTLIIIEKLFDNNEVKKITVNLKSDKKLLSMTNLLLEKICIEYSSIKENAHSKQISKIQWYMLKTTKSRSKYIRSLFQPTEKDYSLVKLPKSASFLYYLVRIFNIIFRIIKSKF